MRKVTSYPTLNEENGSTMTVSEATDSALASASASTILGSPSHRVQARGGYTAIDVPHTIEEVEHELMMAEAERTDPSKWCTSEEMWAEVKKAFPWADIR